MKRSSAVLAVAVVMLAAGAAWAESADVKFVVQRESDGKPIRNASVVLHPVTKDGKVRSAGVQLKTDADGRSWYPSVPYGKLRVQVIAKGYKTFGDDFDINKPSHDIVIKMKAPAEQYSIYK